jgi:hypothetical protein
MRCQWDLLEVLEQDNNREKIMKIIICFIITLSFFSHAGMNTHNMTSKGKVIAIKSDKLKIKSNGGSVFYALKKNIISKHKYIKVGSLVTVRENYSNLLKEYKKNKKK